MNMMMPAPPPVPVTKFTADHAFAFAIMSGNNMVFVGQYLDPASS